MMDFPQTIKSLREDADMTQAQIATLLGTTKNQIGKYERQEQEMPIRHIITLCNYFNVSADFILGLPEGRPYGKSITRR